jgi:hypothetical protein
VNKPKIGSRGEVFVFGGILEIYAVLRRELSWGNLNLSVFEDVGVVPRGPVEEGGPLVCFLCAFGRIWG